MRSQLRSGSWSHLSLEGDEVRAELEREAATEIGVEGCSGAEAVAFRAVVSKQT